MKAEKIFWGIILVFIGVIFLLENFEVIDFSWGHVWRFWPIILIISGVNILFSKYNNKIASIVISIITIIGLGLLTYSGLQTNRYNTRQVFNEGWNDDNNSSSSYSSYSEDYDDSIKYAKLEIVGGASSFEIDSITQKLFEANIEGSNNYILKNTLSDSVANLSFSSKGMKDLKLEENGLGEVKMMLNSNPIWDIKLRMGAGEMDFDFEKYKVRNLDLKGGAAEFKLKLGALLDTVNVNVKTGLASVTIEVPEGVGCSIRSTSGLSSKEFDGFQEKGKGIFETSNFHTSEKKIFLILNGGLSELKVKRYN